MNLVDEFIFKAPFRAMLAGPSNCGKTSFIIEILKNPQKYIYPPPDRIMYCYTRMQESYKNLQNVELVEGLPDMNLFNHNTNNLLVLDDLLEECEENKAIQTLFTVDSHHKNISTFFMTQNLFSRGKCFRTISLNCDYFILFKCPRDPSQIFNFA